MFIATFSFLLLNVLFQNDTVKCSTKGAIYRAYCVSCQVELTGDGGYVKGKFIPTYVGETSRPVRERVHEHLRNLKNWNSDSVILYHWMKHHGTEVTSPEFKFELIGSYNDPLRRQLTEAIEIKEQGTLNSKHEFGVNDLYHLECSSPNREQEARLNLN